MTCKELMTPDPICCSPDESSVRIAKLMMTQNIGSVPICEDRYGKKLLGIVTDRDLALKILAAGRDAARTTAKDVMTRQPVTCRGDDDLEVALDAMEKNQVRRIPVVNENGQLIGIIAQADIAVRGRKPQKTAEVVEEISRPSAKAAYA